MDRSRIKSASVNLLIFILVALIDAFKVYNNLDPADTITGLDIALSSLKSTFFVMGIIWLNHYFFIPYLFDKKRYILYGTLLFLVIFSLALYFGHKKSAFKVFSIFNYYTFTTGIGMSIFFVIRSLNFKKEIIEKEQLQQQMELNYLKAQVNPHFLFNALNSIYSLSRQQSPHTPETVMQLSDLMRYQLESAKNGLVSVGEEISFIQNYLLLEEKRLAGHCRIEFSTEGNVRDLKMAPMLLIPFVENSIKFGAHAMNSPNVITISIIINGNSLQFCAENPMPSNPVVEKREGTGIHNVRRRLNLTYPEKHNLVIKEDKMQFKVDLQIDLSANG